MNRLNSDMHIVTSWMDITMEDMALIFFNEWYCKNGLPLDIILDHDKLFMSKFWQALHGLTGVKLKMSSAYHPQSDGASECSNKTINQCLHYHVEHNQLGWRRVLPQVCFDIMNMINVSTGFSPFQLRMGHSPCIIPPLVSLGNGVVEDIHAEEVIKQLQEDIMEAQDNMLHAKTSQALCTNVDRADDFPFQEGQCVMLSTLHRQQEYKTKGEK